jgi:hypothetical protein
MGWIISSVMSRKHPKSSLCDLVCGPMTSNMWDLFPMEAQARLVLPKMATKKGHAKLKGTPSKDLK